MDAGNENSGLPTKSLYGTTQEHCNSMIQASLRANPMVKFVREALAKAGCPVKDNFFKATICNEEVGGGFLPGGGVVVCSNHVLYQDEVDVYLTHELIHAYDHCRAATLDWANLQHHACSEIRAANLSAACYMHKELLVLGSDFKMRAGHQNCVKRKAQLSVAMNPNCESVEQAKEAVDAAWSKCYKDTAPFDRIP
eukprot:jgi/Mesen1/6241/ME000323S05374